VMVVGSMALSPRQRDLEAKYRAAHNEWNRKLLSTSCGYTKLMDKKLYQEISRVSDADPELDHLIQSGDKILAVKRMRETKGPGDLQARRRPEASWGAFGSTRTRSLATGVEAWSWPSS
jgi:hypothetical protein